jgi:hypothetical protein
MNRAVILIGVAKAESLPKLNAVSSCIDLMKDWALSQTIEEHQVTEISDDLSLVTPDRIKNIVHDLVQQANIDQLIIYFAGHGINIGYHSFWLLSKPYSDPSHAVNLTESIIRARHSGIPHIVFFSDTCRTAAEGIRLQALMGVSIFPNVAVGNKEGFVDEFHATSVGDPAFEVVENENGEKKFVAVYTSTLVEALTGQHESLVEPDDSNGVAGIYLRSLDRFLQSEVPERLYRATEGRQLGNQFPVARITSENYKILITKKPSMPTDRFDEALKPQFDFDVYLRNELKLGNSQDNQS